MRMVTLFIFLTLIGPLYLIGSRQISFFGDYRTANRDSSHLAPLPEASPEAMVQIYSARAFNWNGLFSVHTWIATKAKHGKSYTVYQVVGWRKFRGQPPLLIEENIPDRNWFAQTPKIIYETRGEAAAKLIPFISQAAKAIRIQTNTACGRGQIVIPLRLLSCGRFLNFMSRCQRMLWVKIFCRDGKFSLQRLAILAINFLVWDFFANAGA